MKVGSRAHRRARGYRRTILPTLHDGDLTLRPRDLGDVDALVAACADPEIPRWTRVPSHYTRDLAIEFVQLSEVEAAAGEAIGLFATDDRGTLLGSISIMDLKAEPGYGEIGYWLAKEARGRGYATRAVRLLTDWGHDELGLERIEILVHRDNTASQSVPVRAGYEPMPGLHPLLRTNELEPVFLRYVSRRTR